MRILTVVKQVPDSNASLKVRPDGSGLDDTSLKLVPDPFDEFGVELAIQLREKRGDVEEIVALTAGPDQAAAALRVALAMGADRGIHIRDDQLDLKNELLLAAVIAEAIKHDQADFDLIICGKYTIDMDAGAVGPALAEFLDIPHVGAVQGLDFSEGKQFVAHRRIEGAEEVVEGEVPALFTIEKGLVEPRYPSLPNLMKAKKKPVDVVALADLTIDDTLHQGAKLESLSPPPPKPDCKFIEGEPEAMAKELVKLLREEAKVV